MLPDLSLNPDSTVCDYCHALNIRLTVGPANFVRQAGYDAAGKMRASMKKSQPAHPSGESTKDTLLRISAEILDAICSHDGPTLATYLSDDFTIMASGHRQKREAFLESVIGADFHVLDKMFEMIEVELLGNSAVVSGIQRVTVHAEGVKNMVSREAFTDVFVYEDTSWLLRVACSHELA